MIPLLVALLQIAADPAVYDGRARQLDVAVPRAAAAPVIDGVLDEPVWRRAALLTGFSQYRPVDGLPAVDSTQVLVWYASDAIWFGIRAFEPHPGTVRATLADRDNIDGDDNVQILLDTYADHRRAFLFAVNPLGVQEDGVRSEGQDAGAAGGGGGATGRFDGTVDLNPDFVWQSRGRVTPWGYEVEVRIPFKSLRYQDAEQQDWGIQVVREVQHSGYEDTWTPVVRANASFLIQAGRLSGLRDLHRGLVMDLIPEFTTKVNGDSVGGGRYGYDVSPGVGGTLRWGITNGLTLGATAHPDFSQVEADVAQVTVNQRFALFYPEKRPFFLEGLEQFDTPNRLIYTRQIVQPVAGAKLVGKVGETNVAYLAAVDERDELTGNNPVFNLLRVRHDIGASSALGAVYTGELDGADYNHVASADARVLWRRIWFSQVQVARSWTRDAAGGGRAGTLWDVTFADRTGRAYGNHIELQGVSSDFATRSGFVNRTGYVQARIFNRFTWYGRPGAVVEQLSTFVSASPLWRYDDFWSLRGNAEGGLSNQWSATLRGGWSVNVEFTSNQQRFARADYVGYAVAAPGDTSAFVLPHGLHNLPSGSFGLSTPNRTITASLNVSYGAAPIFAEAAEGREATAQLDLAWRPTPSLRVNATWAHDRLTRARDGSEFAVANIPRLKLEYQPRRAIFFRYVGQYVAQRQVALLDPRTGQPLVVPDAASGAYVPLAGFTTNQFRNDVLLSYKPTPGTVLFLGYGATLVEPEAFAFSRGLRRTTDGFFLKASYLVRM